MKFLNCILFAGLALSANLAMATETKAACSANRGGKLTDSSYSNLFDQAGKAARPESNGSGASR